MAKLQEFYLLRIKDIHGISGLGIVARGIILPSHRVVMEWVMPHETITYFQNIGEVSAIHSHGGATKVILGTPPKKLLDQKHSK